MPPLNPVKSLYQLSMNRLLKLFYLIYSKDELSMDKIKEEIVPYFNIAPIPYKQAIYSKFLEVFSDEIREKGNEKMIVLGMYMRANELRVKGLKTLQQVLSQIDKKTLLENKIENLTITEGIALERRRKSFSQLDTLCNFVKPFVNITSLNIQGLSTDYLLMTISQNCPLLEIIKLQFSGSVSNTGFAYLCGFNSDKEAQEALHCLQSSNSQKFCSNLRHVYLYITLASSMAVAFLLKHCKCLEIIEIYPKISMPNVLDILYGSDNYVLSSIRDRYSLKEFKNDSDIGESHLSLLMTICPHISTIKLKFSGREHRDKKLIANLVNTKVTSIEVINCNIEALLWYLERSGSNLTILNIQIMITALESAHLTRRGMHKILEYCPNLQHLSISVCGSPSFIHNYSDNHNLDIPLKHLNTLKFDGVSLTEEDLDIFLWCTDNIKKIHISCHAPNLSIDFLIDKFFAGGKMKNLTSFYIDIPHPVLNIDLIRKILLYCPLLCEIGPVTLWNISKLEYYEFCAEIIEKNWNLSIYTEINPSTS